MEHPSHAIEVVLCWGDNPLCAESFDAPRAVSIGESLSDTLILPRSGAGDSFAGGFMGYLASRDPAEHTEMDYRLATVYGSAIASYTVEAFSTQRLQNLSVEDIGKRLESFRMLTEFRV